MCFLQGSYKQDTAIYTINDVDVVALCQLWQPAPAGAGRTWSRDEIFDTISGALAGNQRFRSVLDYGPQSMCVKLDLGIKVEILPVVFKAGNNDPVKEPFRLYRPEKGTWEDGYARYHQAHLTLKNAEERTGGHFKPAVKVLKHLRSRFGLEAVSFHLECLLYWVPDEYYLGWAGEWIAGVLGYLARWTKEQWSRTQVWTPCGDRDIFVEGEWGYASWCKFVDLGEKWAACARVALEAANEGKAIEWWQVLLGKEYFPS